MGIAKTHTRTLRCKFEVFFANINESFTNFGRIAVPFTPRHFTFSVPSNFILEHDDDKTIGTRVVSSEDEENDDDRGES